MSEASLAAQRLAVVKMRARPELTALVPSGNIFDRNERPEVFPCVVIGEGQTVGDDIDCADLSEVHLSLHVWTKENGLVACKSIAGKSAAHCEMCPRCTKVLPSISAFRMRSTCEIRPASIHMASLTFTSQPRIPSGYESRKTRQHN